MWKNREVEQVKAAHSGAIESIRWDANCLYTGARDGFIKVFSTPDLAQIRYFKVGQSIKAVDCFNNMILAGTKDGTLCVMGAEGDGSDKKEIMHSHNDGEVWGLSQGSDESTIYTTGDDNKLMVWDTAERKLVKCVEITSEKKDLKGASSQSKCPSSQQGRAVTTFNGKLIVGCNDGAVRVKNKNTFEEIKVLRDAKEWI